MTPKAPSTSSNLPQPIFMGYDLRPDSWDSPYTPPPMPAHILEICSVSNCTRDSLAASDVTNWDRLTSFHLYKTPESAIASLTIGSHGSHSLFAYRLIPALFQHGTQAEQFDPAEYFRLGADDFDRRIGEGFISIGFDAVMSCAPLDGCIGCSPLSCNMLANEHDVNEWCLFPTLDAGIAGAVVFSRDEPEPGPYVVIEVLRHTDRINLHPKT